MMQIFFAYIMQKKKKKNLHKHLLKPILLNEQEKEKTYTNNLHNLSVTR